MNKTSSLTHRRPLLAAVGVLGASAAIIVAPALATSPPSRAALGALPARARHPKHHRRSVHGTAGARLDIRHTRFGTALTDGAGHTLYIFARDHGGHSACYGACATVWPALLTSGHPRAGKGLEGHLLGTAKRKEGKRQVTYAGHPLYTFSGDSAPGQTNGEGLVSYGGRWYAIGPSGRALALTGSPARRAVRRTTAGGQSLPGR